MEAFDFDLFVIGAGSGGVRASRIAAGFGARVGICEEYRVGGTCVIRGCVPKKLMVYASEFSHAFEDAQAYGWSGAEHQFDWARFMAAKNKEIDRLNGIYHRLLENAGVELIQERGTLVDAHTVDLGDRKVTARNILIATGAWPTGPDLPGAELAISSNEIFELSEQPRRVAVYGGGYIAVEFAGIFQGLGTQTTLVYRRDKLLRGFDEDVRDALTEALAESDMDLRLETTITSLAKTDDGIRVSYDNGSEQIVDQVVFATGRNPNIEGLGLEKVGVEINRGAIVVDDQSRTSVPGIYAVGDVTDRINLTPVALMEGQRFAETVFGNKPREVDHEMVPSAVFSQPEVASVGYTEEQARAKFGAIDVYMSSFRPLKHTLSGRSEKMLIKLLVAQESQRVIGCHIVGEHAAEMMQSVAIAVKMGATKAQFDQVIGIHPTAAEELVTMREKAR